MSIACGFVAQIRRSLYVVQSSSSYFHELWNCNFEKRLHNDTSSRKLVLLAPPERRPFVGGRGRSHTKPIAVTVKWYSTIGTYGTSVFSFSSLMLAI